MKYSITIFILFILITIIKCQLPPPPRCLFSDIYARSSYPTLKPNSGYVDWWIYEHFNKPRNNIGGSSFYTDSNLKNQNVKIFEMRDYDMREANQVSPITLTFDQASRPEFSSIAYNNGFYDEYKIGSAHEKGFFIWNEQGGIHVIHSIPKTPQQMNNFFLNSEDNFLQHSICITLKPNELDIIPKYLIYTNPTIAAINSVIISHKILSSLKYDRYVVGIRNIDRSKDLAQTSDSVISNTKQFTNMDTIINKNFIENSILPRDIKIFQWAKLARHIAGNLEFSSSTNRNHPSLHYYRAKGHSFGDYFVQTPIPAKGLMVAGNHAYNLGRMDNIELLWQYIGKYYNGFSNWMSQTMTSNNGFADNVVAGTTFSLTLRLNYPFLKESHQRSASKDHSKLLYGVSDDGSQKIFCLGGLNWQRVQESRGGGAFCMKGIGYLVDYMKRHVSWTRRGVAPVDVKFGVPHSTMGTIISFEWIKDQLTAQGLGFSMGFEISVPTTQHPLSTRVIEPSTSNYKTMKAPLLINYDAVQRIYKTEGISIDVFPSVQERVIICRQQSQCTFESSIKYNIVSNLKLISTPSQANEGAEPTMAISTNPVPLITISPELKSYYFSSLVTEKIIHINNNNTWIYLDQTGQTVNEFTFEFSPTHISTQCNIVQIRNDAISVKFHQSCIDQLVYCLFGHFNMNSLNNRPVFININQGSFYNDVTYVLNELFTSIPADITRCVAQPPPPGSNDPNAMSDNDSNMVSQSTMNDNENFS
ncbi:hypothetical protein ACTFIU_002069 [Dictyostelium citrinum]